MTEQQSLRSDPDADSSPRRDDLWRSEIADRIAGYRHRRGRRVEGAFSMRFPFPPTEADAASPAEDEVCLEDEANATVEEGFAGDSSGAGADAFRATAFRFRRARTNRKRDRGCG